MGGSQNYGYHFGGPYNKDCSILGSILGSPHFGKLPNMVTSSINCSSRTHKYSCVTRGPLLVEGSRNSERAQ